MGIYIDKYKNMDCIVLDNDDLRVKIIPDQGAKIVSIYFKKINYEALIQNSSEYFISSAYADDFTCGEMAGSDDMFPAVSKCTYQNEEYIGTVIPDHGEVWALRWGYVINDESITLSAKGKCFPYTFSKTMKLINNKIHIDYNVINDGDRSLDYIWTLHPLFKASEGMEILLPDTVKNVINVYADNIVMGNFGTVYDWPNMVDVDGNIRNLSVVPKSDGTCMKFYVLGSHDRWCALRSLRDNIMIKIDCSHQINYLGIWLDYMGYAPKPLYNVALEPCIGGYDSLELAQKTNTCSTLLAKQQHDWAIDITLENFMENA